jgi:hypothetical protein
MSVERCGVDAAEHRADCSAVKEFKIGLHVASPLAGLLTDANHNHGEAAVSNKVKRRLRDD